MAFDEEKNVVLKEWKSPLDDGCYLHISLVSYDGGEPKLQIGPRDYKDKDGEVKPGRLGRLGWDDMQFLSESVQEAIDFLGENPNLTGKEKPPDTDAP